MQLWRHCCCCCAGCWRWCPSSSLPRWVPSCSQWTSSHTGSSCEWGGEIDSFRLVQEICSCNNISSCSQCTWDQGLPSSITSPWSWSSGGSTCLVGDLKVISEKRWHKEILISLSLGMHQIKMSCTFYPLLCLSSKIPLFGFRGLPFLCTCILLLNSNVQLCIWTS